jgi:hypothetical protein
MAAPWVTGRARGQRWGWAAGCFNNAARIPLVPVEGRRKQKENPAAV